MMFLLKYMIGIPLFIGSCIYLNKLKKYNRGKNKFEKIIDYVSYDKIKDRVFLLGNYTIAIIFTLEYILWGLS